MESNRIRSSIHFAVVLAATFFGASAEAAPPDANGPLGAASSAMPLEHDGTLVGTLGGRLVRYTRDGKRDFRFGHRGVVSIGRSVLATAPDHDGRFVVLGLTT